MCCKILKLQEPWCCYYPTIVPDAETSLVAQSQSNYDRIAETSPSGCGVHDQKICPCDKCIRGGGQIRKHWLIQYTLFILARVVIGNKLDNQIFELTQPAPWKIIIQQSPLKCFRNSFSFNIYAHKSHPAAPKSCSRTTLVLECASVRVAGLKF